jgi:polyphosphate glucokinase
MQALGAYDGGRMLFLGLGTGLGSALVSERVLVPLELGGLASDDGQTLARRLGKAALEERGHDAWQRGVEHACAMLKDACDADYITLGGGNAAHVDPLPPATRRGGNDDAFAGGVRLWEDWVEEHDVPRSNVWRVVW